MKFLNAGSMKSPQIMQTHCRPWRKRMAKRFPSLVGVLQSILLIGAMLLSSAAWAGVAQPIAPLVFYTGSSNPNAPAACQYGTNRDAIGQACAQWLTAVNGSGWTYTYAGYSGDTNPFTYIFNQSRPGEVTMQYEIGAWIQHSCTTGYALSGNTCLPNGAHIPAKNQDCFKCDEKTGKLVPNDLMVANPIHIGTGSKHQTETDYRAGSSPLTVQRTYSSTVPGATTLGTGWRHHYDRSVLLLTNASISTAFVNRPTGQTNAFTLNGSVWTPDSDIADKLIRLTDGAGNPSGWQYTTTQDDIERYDVNGRLLTITQRGGRKQTLAYDTQGRLATVTDSYGAKLTFGYDTNNRLSSVTDPANGLYQYAYGSNNNLASVTYPDTKVRQYWYEDPAYPNALTGITDENGTRFATWKYDTQGRAYSSEHATGIDQVTLTYQATGTTAIDAIGTARTTTFETILGVIKSTGSTQPAGAGSSAAANSTTYDSNGNIASHTDFNGNLTTYVHDLVRNLETSRVEASGTPQARTITTVWHPTYRLPSAVYEPKLKTSFTYDAAGNMLTKTVQATTDTTGASGASAAVTGIARKWTYTYNTVGQVLTINGPRTDVTDLTTFTYDTVTGNLVTVTNALNQTATLSNYDANGRVGTITDPNGIVTHLTYYPRGWLKDRSVTAAGGSSKTTRYDYDSIGQLKQVTLPDLSTVTYTYDDAHRLTDITDSLGNTIHYTLDDLGNRTGEQVKDPSGNLTRQLNRAIDALNRLQQLATPSGATRYEYDANGNLTQITDPLTRVTNQSYDPLNRLTQQLQPPPVTGAARPVVQYQYDGLDQLASVTDPRNLITRYTVDGLGNRTTLASPDTGSTINTYDPAGNLKTSKDARGKTTTYTYDALNRVTKIAYAAGTATVLEYDGGTAGAPNAKGKLTKVTDESGQTTYSYDDFGRLASKKQTVGTGTSAKNFTVSYAYTPNDQLAGITYPSGNRINVSYNSAGRASAITLNPTNTNGIGTNTGSTINLATDIGSAPFGAAQTWTWGNSSSSAKGIDLDGRITSYPLGHPLNNGTHRTLGYDAASRIYSATHTGSGTGSNAPALYNQTIGYDDLDRLTSYSGSGTTQAFQYDANGNRTQATFGATPYVNTIAATSNRLSSTAGPAPAKTNVFDLSGNLTGDGTITFTYSARGRMASAKNGANTFTYLYNGINQRVKKSGATSVIATGANYYVYDEQGQLLGQYDANGKVIQETVYLENLPLTVLKQTTTGTAPNQVTTTHIYYIHADHINTPRVITRASDNKMVWRWDYTDPFGMFKPNENPAGLGTFAYDPRFQGQVFDKESNLHYNYHRDYDPATGRYVQSDPLGLAAGMNTYGYVGGNPVSKTDPSGLIVWVPGAVGGVIGGVAGGIGYLSSGAPSGSMWQAVLAATVIGAAAAYVPATYGIGGAFVGGVLAGSGGDVAGQYIGQKASAEAAGQCFKFDWIMQQTGIQGALGGLGGIGGYGVGLVARGVNTLIPGALNEGAVAAGAGGIGQMGVNLAVPSNYGGYRWSPPTPSGNQGCTCKN